MAESNLQIRLTDADAQTFALLEEWYPNLGRTALVRLALTELARYAAGAKKRKQEAEVLAQHMPRVEHASPQPGRKWFREMDEIKEERRAQGLPVLSYDALLAHGTARKLERE